MRRAAVLICVIFLLAVPVDAMEFSAPTVPKEAQRYMPDDSENFGEGLRYVIQSAVDVVLPSMVEASGICVSLIAASVLIGLLSEVSGSVKVATNVVGIATVGILLFQPANSLIHLGAENVRQISQYGKLLLPVMTGALAAQGAVTKSGALYTATVFFDAFLSSAVSTLLIPLVYIFLCVAIGGNLFDQQILKNMRKFLKWLITWGLKTVLYIFTGYISITGVVGGTTDAMMLKATKLTISGAVPVVGNILADASEAVLVSAGMMKNAAGIYGLLAIVALWIGPFLQISIQYVMLNITSGICELFGTKEMSALIKDFSTAMGQVLAMTSAVCLIFMISTICFMKGVS